MPQYDLCVLNRHSIAKAMATSSHFIFTRARTLSAAKRFAKRAYTENQFTTL